MSEFGEAGNRSGEEGDHATMTDRLSHLPGFIIDHILSFLDTKSAVQTSVLSSSWRSAWKHVPVLDLRRDSFHRYSSFLSFVDAVLSLRHPLNARKISYTDGERAEARDPSLLIRLIQCALSDRTTQHLVITLADYLNYPIVRFSELFCSVLDSNLKTLELEGVALDRGYESPCFRLVESLELRNCMLLCTYEGDRDPFSKLPNLENLVLSSHLSSSELRVSGRHMPSLKMFLMFPADLEIFAPKLRSFSLWNNWTLFSFSGLSLPSLDHAHIQVHARNLKKDRVRLERDLTVLFQGLRNAKSLKLHVWTIQALSGLYEFLEQQPSAVTRLELLIVEADDIPSQLVDYFFKGTTAEPKIKFLPTSATLP